MDILDRLDPIGLDEMEEVRFMNRTDTKYVLPTREVTSLLKEIGEEYQVLDIAGNRMGRYETLYFDTPSYDFYIQHHNGKKNRVKVRYRKYIDSDVTFLEVKKKNNKNRTIKLRKRVADISQTIEGEDLDFVEVAAEQSLILMPSVRNVFRRTTLVSKNQNERATIDFNVELMLNGKSITLPGLSIIEAKQDLFNKDSKIVRTLKDRHCRSMRVSKYCLGIALLSENLKTNNYKKKLRKIEEYLQNEPAT
ncbi:polyphosphate polymerase domain-containing protein [Halocola ammonii]